MKRWGVWGLAAAFVWLVVAVLANVVPALGWLSAVAVLAGALAYALMATNLLLAVRHPVLERLFAPLDRVYRAHRAVGVAVMPLAMLHAVLIPIASLVDRDRNILTPLSIALPLGVLGLLVLAGSVGLAMAGNRVAYHRWQRVHMAIAASFLVLTGHLLIGATLWFSLGGPLGAVLALFAALGLVSLVVRVVGKAREGIGYTVTRTVPRERGLEVMMRPLGARTIGAHRPGQFVFLTATLDGSRETHPFTLTSARGQDTVSLLIRGTGDWTGRLQQELAVGDEVRLDGPFGGFTPSVGRDAPPHQVWVAGGAGITPFLSVLRTSSASASRPAGTVELVLAAVASGDVPCWDEVSGYPGSLPWLTVTPAFSEAGGRLEGENLDRLVTSRPADAEWFLCGPAGLTAGIESRLRQGSARADRVHRELYQWR